MQTSRGYDSLSDQEDRLQRLDPVRNIATNLAMNRATNLANNLDAKLYAFAEHTVMRKQLSLSRTSDDTSWFSITSLDPLTPRSAAALSFSHGDCRYRLRCIKLPIKRGQEHTVESLWPQNVAVYVNGHNCIPNRPPRSRRCAPIDVSTCLSDGVNKLRVVLSSVPKAVDVANYAFVIDSVRCLSHNQVLLAVKLRPKTVALQQIVRSLINGDSLADDDLMVVSSSRTISLLDPYSNVRQLQRPVRSESCLHAECFDLEIYLSQQLSHDGRWPAKVEGWQCPICKGPAAPHQLLEDGFLLDVLRELEREDEPRSVKAVEVQADGTWIYQRVNEKSEIEDLSRCSIPRLEDLHEVIELD